MLWKLSHTVYLHLQYCNRKMAPPEAHVVERKPPGKKNRQNQYQISYKAIYNSKTIYIYHIYKATEIIAFAIEKVERLQNAPAQSFMQCLTENKDNSAHSSFRKDFQV